MAVTFETPLIFPQKIQSVVRRLLFPFVALVQVQQGLYAGEWCTVRDLCDGALALFGLVRWNSPGCLRPIKQCRCTCVEHRNAVIICCFRFCVRVPALVVNHPASSSPSVSLHWVAYRGGGGDAVAVVVNDTAVSLAVISSASPPSPHHNRCT